MEKNTKKRYLMVTETDLSVKCLTGAHRRFLELLMGISRDSQVVVIAPGIPEECMNSNIILYKFSRKYRRYFPDHINGMIDLSKKIKKMRNKIDYDFSISFGPTTTICLKKAGYKNITSLFREDLIGYQNVVSKSKLRKQYFLLQERLAVRASDKIIVQCVNDRNSLIERNRKYCGDIESKVYIQINNANASWMKTEAVASKTTEDSIIKILFIGDFSNRRKGHGILLPAVARLLDEENQMELYIAGAGVELELYKEKYRHYPQIHFLGRVTRMEDYLTICDFEVVPSLIDSCPNTVLEGLNAGIAVYGANTGGIPDMLVEKKYMFEPSVDALYLFLRNILDNKCYIMDRVEQEELKERLTFDWSTEILEKINKCEQVKEK